MTKFITKHKKTFAITLMMLPGAIWLLVLRYIPMGGLVIAFQDYRPFPQNPTFLNNILNSRFVGFDNFRFIFATDRAWNMIRNTLAYNAVFIVLTTILSIALAVCLSEIGSKFLAKTYQTLMFFPFFISWVVASYFVFAFLDPTFGVLSHMRNWYLDPAGWPVILTISHLWKSLGFSCIIYLAAITGIDQGLYEAAAIDGASKWRQVWAITIPSIKPMIIMLFIMAVGRIFNADFGLFWNIPMNMGPLQNVTEVFDTYVFRVMQAPIAGAIGMATAAGFFQNIIGFVCILGANFIVRRVDRENAMF
ncbi:MAG: ABC transporter permease subunit [Defluviitaleaceae bacterium]|nr:ABC transporter permease subunit [Defluviitaleaceae bacterium]